MTQNFSNWSLREFCFFSIYRAPFLHRGNAVFSSRYDLRCHPLWCSRTIVSKSVQVSFSHMYCMFPPVYLYFSLFSRCMCVSWIHTEYIYIYIYIYIYTECHRRNGPNFGRVFLMLKYTDITQNNSIQSWTVTEIMAREVWNFDSCYTLIDCQIHIETGRNMWFL